MYDDTRINVEAALADIGVAEIDYFLWWQGESDRFFPHKKLYQERLDDIVSAYESES